MRKRLTIKEKEEDRGRTAYDRWRWYILSVSKEYVIPGRNDLDDLITAGMIELSEMLLEHSDWDPTGTDFEKMFKTRFGHRMLDLVRMARAQKRSGVKEVSLETVAYKVVSRMPDEVHTPADLRIVGINLYDKIRSDLDDDQRAILQLLVHPHDTFLEYCGGGDSSRPDKIRGYLGMSSVEFKYHMNRIKQVTSLIQSDYQSESIYSVVRILALPKAYALVPYWAVVEKLDAVCNRLLFLLVFSDLPVNVSLVRLSNTLNLPKQDVAGMLTKIGEAITSLHNDGVLIPEINRDDMVCSPGRIHNCQEPARYMCYETGVKGCDKHLGHCRFNMNHRFVGTLQNFHEEHCAKNTRGHGRECMTPNCNLPFVARCFETGNRGCDTHLSRCKYNPEHRMIRGKKKVHEVECAKHPEWHKKRSVK